MFKSLLESTSTLLLTPLHADLSLLSVKDRNSHRAEGIYAYNSIARGPEERRLEKSDIDLIEEFIAEFKAQKSIGTLRINKSVGIICRSQPDQWVYKAGLSVNLNAAPSPGRPGTRSSTQILPPYRSTRICTR